MDNVEKPKRKLHVTPTVKQIKALELMSKGYNKRRAMIEAGYSVGSANHSNNLVTRSRAAEQITEAMKSQLITRGIDVNFMIDKFVKWMNAKKKDKDDYKTQQAAYKFWKDIMDPKDEPVKGIKRKVTFEEFIGDEK